jgi:hypothetical protein
MFYRYFLENIWPDRTAHAVYADDGVKVASCPVLGCDGHADTVVVMDGRQFHVGVQYVLRQTSEELLQEGGARHGDSGLTTGNLEEQFSCMWT